MLSLPPFPYLFNVLYFYICLSGIDSFSNSLCYRGAPYCQPMRQPVVTASEKEQGQTVATLSLVHGHYRYNYSVSSTLNALQLRGIRERVASRKTVQMRVPLIVVALM